ncbi:putative branched-chain-amino-acid aminotransferase [Candidatus Zixiibacteriota bacterium]|nr:putative branched-chain-amino-acid aminotransferase [candidate division Zixibacteria bacterium]
MQINCSINGRAISPNRASIPIFDNSLFYADGLFETLLAVKNRVVFLNEHLKRLEKGAKLIRLRLPVSTETISTWIIHEVGKNPSPVTKIRLTVTAGDSAFWRSRASLPRIIIIVTDYKIPTGSFSLTVSPFRVDETLPFRNIKTLAFIIEMTSRKTAYMKGFDDAILLNRSGHVAEATSANIFWMKNGRLYTPPLSSGCLEGMTRRHILKLARETGLKTLEKKAHLNEVLEADEIFISSSLKLIVPVTKIKADKMHHYDIGGLTLKLQSLLKHMIFSGEE